ncbi:hypothetical protein LR004_02900 [Candidatus Gracilibacteria bacterium]|nr:hypothetical protein [Candidatus Gracilibacteria bacterium]
MKAKNYSPLYFLASLGAGGTSAMFFMYLMFMTKHPDTPVPTFNSLLDQFGSGDLLIQAMIIFAIAGIIFFAVKHFQLLIWNLKNLSAFKKTPEFKELKKGNKEVQLMTLPLTLAMSINVIFIIGAVFVPNLWSVVEYLFPFALLAFGAVGILSLKLFGDYMTRLLTTSSFDFVQNNNLGQMIAIFAFAMVGVGFAASAAMSHTELTAILGIVFSTFFSVIALFFGTIKVILGFKSILKNGINTEMSPTLWIMIPILTLLGITYVRQTHGFHHHLEMTTDPGTYFMFTTAIISLQAIFGFIGYKVMKANNYFKDYIHGDKKSPGSYALICPGVALVVFGFFFLHLGLVKTGIIDKFGIAYFLLLLPLLYLQFTTILTMWRLNKKMF